MTDTIAKAKAIKLLEDHSDSLEMIEFSNKEIWILDDGTIVKLEKGHKRIDVERLQEIAIELLEMSPHDFDYWLGQNG